MLLKVHSKSGHSFRGVMEYLTDANKPEAENRVEWCVTKNLGTQDAMTASKIMAATHYQQNDLKKAAGVSNRGRNSGGPVMHYTLSFREDEIKAGLTREVMLAQAEKTLEVLGKDTTKLPKKKRPKDGGVRQFADEHQVVIICHKADEVAGEPHPHCHIVVNRCHPVHGRTLSDSNDFLKLSKVGSDFEVKNNKIVCPERQVNRQARENGAYVKANRELPRKVWEKANKSAANDKERKHLLDEQRQEAARLSKNRRDLAKRHRQQWSLLEERSRKRAHTLFQKKETAIRQSRHAITQQYLDKRRYQQAASQADLRAFEKREKTLLGRIQNRYQSIDVKAVLGLRGEEVADGKAKTAFKAIEMLGSAHARLLSIKEKHHQEDIRINKEEKKEVRSAIDTAKDNHSQAMAKHRDRYQADRFYLSQKQKLEMAKTRSEWKEFSAKRDAQWEATPQRDQTPRTKPGDLEPRSKRGAQQVDNYMERVADAAKKDAKMNRQAKDQAKDGSQSQGR